MVSRCLLMPLLLAWSIGVAASAEEAPVFPDPASILQKGGTFPPLDNVRNVMPGMNKDQLYGLLGVPHFDEGFRARTWNYLFRFRRAHVLLVCQYQVRFDSAMEVESTWWREKNCENFAAQK